ncbi:MAG: hypothetical protein LQ350_006791 [Teloschistes chrysophthalmus]|nr:MAG: hypothetical protein LQ350_006791 [Niorma chrysophthalma]
MAEHESTMLDIISEVQEEQILLQQHRETFLLPYMNIETLSKDGSRLLRLLFHRVKHLPEEFVTALLILEAQAYIAKFLRDFVTSMLASAEFLSVEESTKRLETLALDEAQQSSETNDANSMQFALPAVYRQKLTFFYDIDGDGNLCLDFLTLIASQEPFSPPPLFDNRMIEKLIDVASEKLAEAQDNLWLLQTDPGYFHWIASYWDEHDIGNFPGAQMSKVSMKQALSSRLIVGSISDVMAWQDIFNGMTHVRHKYESHREDIRPGRHLPEQYARTLAALWSLILDLLKMRLPVLQELTLVAPAWKNMWKAVPELSDETTTNFRLKNRDAVHYAEWWKDDRIFYILAMLGDRADSFGYHDNADLLKALDNHLAVSKKSEAGKIDFMVYTKITETAALQRVLAALRMHRPMIPLEYGFIKEAMKLHDLPFRWRFQPSAIAFQALWSEPKNLRLGNMLNSLDKFRMPSGKKDLQWLERADNARQALRQVWSIARDSHERMYRSAGIDVDSQDGPLKLFAHFDSPELQSIVAQERHEILGKLEQSKKPKTVVPAEPYETLIPHGPRNRDPLTKFGNKVPTKAKVKSRQAPDLSTTSAEEQKDAKFPEYRATPGSLPALPLPKKSRSLHTLRLLFATATSDLQGMIHWHDLLSTMAEHRGGSEWTFRTFQVRGPDGQGVVQEKQSIVIHQPHPDQQMPAVRLQWIGKRLWRRFGWGRERFVGL